MAHINITDENSKDIHEHMVYAAAVVANIRARLDKFYECYMDDSDLLRIWGGTPWLDSTGNLHDRVRALAREMDAEVEWFENKKEAHFTRKAPYYIIKG